MKMVGGTGIIGQDMVCGFGNGKYKTFEGTEISIENCLKAKVKDLVVEGKTYQNLVDSYKYTTTPYASVCYFKWLKSSTEYTAIINNPSDYTLRL